MPGLCFIHSSVLALLSLLLVAKASPSWGVDFWEESPSGPSDAETGVGLFNDIVAVLGGSSGEAFRRSFDQGRSELEAGLRPMFTALPGSAGGRLGATAIRYALYRLFLNRRGWLVKGLDPEGQAWNGTSVATMPLLERLPEGAQSAVAKRLAGPGMNLQEVVVLAALLQHHVHEEAARHLRAVYGLLGLDTSSPTAAVTAQEALETYTAGFALGRDPTRLKWADVTRDLATIRTVYPHWPYVQESLSKALQQKVNASSGALDFGSAMLIAQHVGDTLARWQEPACQAMKASLVKIEDQGSGRVRLSDFYGKALHEGTWQFSESEAYLRQLGALDESNVNNKRVIIPNYIQGASNCLGTSEYLSVCCARECDSILQQIELGLGTAEPLPSDIAATVATLPSATVGANRSFSSVMLHRLKRIAVEHNGRIPLHGRLFAQWLHHAYPRECPFPHLSGKTRPLRTEDWVRSTGLDVVASPKAMAEHAGEHPSAKKALRASRPVENMPWSYQEELFVPQPERPTGLFVLHGAVYAAALAVTAFGFLLVRLARASRKAARDASAGSEPKLYSV